MRLKVRLGMILVKKNSEVKLRPNLLFTFITVYVSAFSPSFVPASIRDWMDDLTCKQY